ncbi:MAG: hypothetical protein J5I93_23650 [Pirellulaceae bacterium]|nr:hypothetical protein [Pirellulaceae bacterium]
MQRCRCGIVTIVLLVALAGVAQARTWTSITGTSREGRLAGRDGDRVLLRDDEQAWTIPLAKLIPADRDYVERNTGPRVEQAQRQLDRLWEELRQALAERRLEALDDLLRRAASAAVSDPQRELVGQAQEQVQAVRSFWEAYSATAQWLQSGQPLTLAPAQAADLTANRATVVRRDAETLTLQVGEQTFLVPWRELSEVPSALAVTLARRGLPASPAGLAALRAFLHLDSAARETQLWAAAADRFRQARPAPVGPPVAPTIAQFEQEVGAIRQLLKAEYEAARLPQQRLELAQKLYEQAGDLRDNDPTASFVLMWESARMLAELGRLDAALDVVSPLEQAFEIEQLAARKGELIAAAALVPKRDDELHLRILKACFAHLPDTLQADEFDVAERLLEGATATTNMLQDRSLKASYGKQTAEAKARLRRLRAEFVDWDEAGRQLQTEPDSADANLVVGRQLCLRKNRWPEGLPHLARGSDQELAAVAQLDLQLDPQGLANVDQKVDLGNMWWDLSEQKSRQLDREALQARAVFWYEQVREEVRGSRKVLVDVRLDEYQQQLNKDDAPGRVWLTSLRPQSVEGVYLRAGEGLPRRNVLVGGTTRDQALWAQPSEVDGVSRIGYRLDRQYLKLRGMVGFDDSYKPSVRVGAILFGANGGVVLPPQGGNPGAWNPVVFRIQNEKGKVLWGPTLVTSGQSVPFDVAVGNSEAIFLITACQGAPTQAPAVWADPVLIRK